MCTCLDPVKCAECGVRPRQDPIFQSCRAASRPRPRPRGARTSRCPAGYSSSRKSERSHLHHAGLTARTVCVCEGAAAYCSVYCQGGRRARRFVQIPLGSCCQSLAVAVAGHPHAAQTTPRDEQMEEREDLMPPPPAVRMACGFLSNRGLDLRPAVTTDPDSQGDEVDCSQQNFFWCAGHARGGRYRRADTGFLNDVNAGRGGPTGWIRGTRRLQRDSKAGCGSTGWLSPGGKCRLGIKTHPSTPVDRRATIG
jgi:hypothetical protein